MSQPKILITADTHFLHERAIHICKDTRPFSSVKDMDEAILDGINSEAEPRDSVYILGDFCFSNKSLNGMDYAETVKYYRKQIRCKNVYLIRGNHDRHSGEEAFNKVYDYFKLQVDGQKYIMSHYPMLCWASNHSGSYMLHGHTHSQANWFIEKYMKHSKMLDVGIDNAAKVLGKLKPFTIPEINDYMKDKLGFCPDISETHQFQFV